MSKFKKNENYFNEIKTELQAYLLGFFLADGCIIKPKTGAKCIGMCLQESDKCVLEWFTQEISPQSKISQFHKKSTGNIQYNIKFTAPSLIKSLEDLYLIKPKKTQDLDFIFPFSKIPDDLTHHFVRGFFDGDGTITVRKKGLVPQFGFVATSKKFLEQLAIVLPFDDYRLIETQGKNMVYYQLMYSCGHGKDIDVQSYLYKDAHYYLERKYNKFLENTELTNNLIVAGSVERRGWN